MSHHVGGRRHFADGRRLEQALHEAAVGLFELERRLAHARAFLQLAEHHVVEEGRADDDGENKQKIGDRRRRAHVIGAPDVHGMECHRFRRGTGPAARHDVRQVDDLEGFDHADQQHRHGDRDDLRPDDLAENLNARGAVHLGCLDMVARHVFKGCQHADEDEGNPLPGIADHHDEAGCPRIG